MSRDCAKARQLLSERLDRPLDAREQAVLQQHLAHCPACVQYEQTLLGGLAGIAALPSVPGSLAVRAAVRDHIEQRRGRAWLGQGAKVLVAATACLLFTLALAAILRGGAPTLGDEQPELAAGQSIGAGATETSSSGADIVATPSVAPGSATVCLPSILTSPAGAGQELPANAFRIWVVVELAEGCVPLAEEVAITLVDADGAPLAVESNPITLPVISLSSRPLTYVSVVWENWCGVPDVSVEAAHGLGGAGRSLDATPACVDAGAPSRLTASDTPPAEEALPPLATATADATCALALSSLEMTQEPFGDNVTITVSGLPAQSCGEDAMLSISLVDGSGALLDVENNPAVVPAHTMNDDSRLYAAVNWTNWCGDAQPLVALESKEGHTGEPTDLTPACLDPNAPSRLVWESYADAAEGPLPVCTVDQIGLSLSIERSHGDVLIAANAGTEDLSGALMPECLLPAEKPTMTLTDTAGNPLDIEGNGVTVNFSVLDSYQLAAPLAGFAHAVWENWCDAPTAVVVQANFGDATAELTIDEPPACADPEAPSRIASINGDDAAANEPMRACGPDELAYILSVEPLDGGLVIAANAGAQDHRAGELPPLCYLPSAELTLTLTDAEGNALPIEGNGLVFDFTSSEEGFNVVAPVAGFALALWDNWCGDAETIVARATFDSRTAELVIDSPPECTNDASPSTLAVLPELEPLPKAQPEATEPAP